MPRDNIKKLEDLMKRSGADTSKWDKHRIREEFIHYGSLILLDRLRKACGEEGVFKSDGSLNSKYHDEIVDSLLPIIHSVQDREKMSLETKADVIKLVASGKVSFNEAVELMKLFGGDGMGTPISFNINTQGEDKDGQDK